MAEVLLVSKPLTPPWTDGAKNLVHHLVTHASGRHRFHCMVPKGSPAPGPVSTPVEIYGGAGEFTPSKRQNLRVLWRLIQPDKIPIYHFFFAPNPRTNKIARAVFQLKKRRVVHTVVSEPVGEAPWFADVHVVLSEATKDRLEAAGAPNVHLIAPGIPAKERINSSARNQIRHQLNLSEDTPLVLFAGDLSNGGGADILAEAIADVEDAIFVFACRPKGHGHAERHIRLQQRLGDRARWLGEVDDMNTLIDGVDLQCLPASSLMAKMDLPMVLLESLRSKIPVVISDIAPLNELGGVNNGVVRVKPNCPGTLAREISALLSDNGRRQELGEAGQNAIRNQFSALAMTRAYEALYDSLLG